LASLQLLLLTDMFMETICFRVLNQEMSCANPCSEKKDYSAALIPTKNV